MDAEYFYNLCMDIDVDPKYIQFLDGEYLKVFMLYASSHDMRFAKIEKMFRYKRHKATCVFDTAARRLRKYKHYAELMGVDKYIKKFKLPKNIE